MFRINTFGQSSGSPFGSPSVSGQSNNASTDLFAPKPFGITGAFGSQTVSSIFSGTSTGVFGVQSSSPLGSTSGFGAFGASTPAFGNTSSAFGGSSVFGPRNAFGAFGSAVAQTSPSVGSFQQSQPAFGNSVFGASTPFGVQSQPPHGTTAFGATSSPAFGGATLSTSAFGASNAPSIGFGLSTPSIGQTASTFGTSSAFGTQRSVFGVQTTSPNLGGASPFGGQRGGSRVAPYSSTPDAEAGTGTQSSGKLESLTAMSAYKEKSHEELRWEDYHLGDKGDPAPAFQTSPTSTTSVNLNPFSSSTYTNPFAPKTSTFSTVPGSSPFLTLTTSNPFGPKPSSTSSSFGVVISPSNFSSFTTSTFGPASVFAPSSSQAAATTPGGVLGFGNTQSSPLFQQTPPTLTQTTPSFGQPNTFNMPSAPSSSQATTTTAFGGVLGFGNTQSSPLLQTTMPTLTQTTPGFSQPNFFSTTPAGTGGNLLSTPPQSNFSFPVFGQTTSNDGFSFNNTLQSLNSSLTTPLQLSQPTQSAFSLNTVGQSQPGFANESATIPGVVGNAVISQPSGPQSSVLPQAAQITNPFGNMPVMPQISINFHGTSPSVQYGISSLPVVEKPVPARISPLLTVTSRFLSQSYPRLPMRNNHPKTDGPKVPFFMDNEEMPSAPKADALYVFVPRENPRALVVRSFEQWPSRPIREKPTPSNHENGDDAYAPTTGKQKTNGLSPSDNEDVSYISRNGHRANVESLIPKLSLSDYYTEPSIQDLAAKERAEPGYCTHVKDFVVGRKGCGSIKFLGVTDITRLYLDSLIQFNNREVIVYMDESKKPPVGQGLNKPAELTLLNVKCFDKQTGQQHTEGPRIDKYEDMLKRKAEEQGAQFVSYEPVKGVWKFRVDHF